MIIDIKSYLTRKARFVAGGHMMVCPNIVTYSSVVSRDFIRILLTLAALNNLQVLSTDIQGAYLYALPREKAYFIAGSEFGSRKGSTVIIIRALYGMKSSGSAFRAKLCEDLREFGYFSSYGDPDVWMRPRTNQKGEKYYEYISTYVDDLLIISHDPSYFCSKLTQIFKLKDGFNKPSTFLGSEVVSFKASSGDLCYGLSSEKYIYRVVSDLEAKLKKRGMVLPKSVAPMDVNYHPELDNTNPLNEEDIIEYQAMIGILRWIVETIVFL